MINEAESLAMQALEILLAEIQGYKVTKEKQVNGRFEFVIVKQGEQATFKGVAQREQGGGLSIQSLTIVY